jgi:ribosomal protein S16
MQPIQIPSWQNFYIGFYESYVNVQQAADRYQTSVGHINYVLDSQRKLLLFQLNSKKGVQPSDTVRRIYQQAIDFDSYRIEKELGGRVCSLGY